MSTLEIQRARGCVTLFLTAQKRRMVLFLQIFFSSFGHHAGIPNRFCVRRLSWSNSFALLAKTNEGDWVRVYWSLPNKKSNKNNKPLNLWLGRGQLSFFCNNRKICKTTWNSTNKKCHWVKCCWLKNRKNCKKTGPCNIYRILSNTVTPLIVWHPTDLAK